MPARRPLLRRQERGCLVDGHYGRLTYVVRALRMRGGDARRMRVTVLLDKKTGRWCRSWRPVATRSRGRCAVHVDSRVDEQVLGGVVVCVWMAWNGGLLPCRSRCAYVKRCSEKPEAEGGRGFCMRARCCLCLSGRLWGERALVRECVVDCGWRRCLGAAVT